MFCWPFRSRGLRSKRIRRRHLLAFFDNLSARAGSGANYPFLTLKERDNETEQRDALNAAAAQGQAPVQTQAESFGRSLFAAQVNDASLSDTQFVTNLYEAFLQRGPDAGGLGFWSGQASVGTGRQNVLGAFATWPAFRELARTLYREANWLVRNERIRYRPDN